MEIFLQQSWKRFFLPAQNYRLAARIESHKGPTNCFAIIGDAELLASGGDDETVKVWDLTSYELKETLIDMAGRWGQVTCLQWICLDNNVPGSGLLCVGTGRGRVVIYKRQRRRDRFVESSDIQVFYSGDSVETLAFDPVNFRVVITSHHGKIKMFRLSGEELSFLWTVELNEAIPRSAHFINRGEDILVYALENGEITCRDAQTAALKNSRILKSAIGNMDVDELEKTIVVDNMRSGFDVYPIHRSTPLHTFEVPTKRNFVRMVVFGEKGTVIVGGSDHGKVYIFDLKTPQLVQYFIHGKPTSLIQAIITTSLETRHLIVTGSSDDKSSICVWEKPASHQYLCSAHRFNWAMTLQTQRALLHKRRENKRRGEVGLVLTLLFLNLVFGIISPAWFQAFKKDLADISTRARSAAEKALTDPFETSRGQERIQGTTIPQDALVIPRDIAMQLPHGVLMQLGEQTARSINIGHRFTENDFQNSQEVVAESIAKPELE